MRKLQALLLPLLLTGCVQESPAAEVLDLPPATEEPPSIAPQPVCTYYGEGRNTTCFTYARWHSAAPETVLVRIFTNEPGLNGGGKERAWQAEPGASNTAREFQFICHGGTFFSMADRYLTASIYDLDGDRIRERTVREVPCSLKADVVDVEITRGFDLSARMTTDSELPGWCWTREAQSCEVR